MSDFEEQENFSKTHERNKLEMGKGETRRNRPKDKENDDNTFERCHR